MFILVECKLIRTTVTIRHLNKRQRGGREMEWHFGLLYYRSSVVGTRKSLIRSVIVYGSKIPCKHQDQVNSGIGCSIFLHRRTRCSIMYRLCFVFFILSSPVFSTHLLFVTWARNASLQIEELHTSSQALSCRNWEPMYCDSEFEMVLVALF